MVESKQSETTSLFRTLFLILCRFSVRLPRKLCIIAIITVNAISRITFTGHVSGCELATCLDLLLSGSRFLDSQEDLCFFRSE